MELREKIVWEALRLFSLKGYLSTSIQDILAAANTSKGGFYNHFRSKEELFFAVLGQAKRIWREKNLAGMDQIEKPVAKVKKLLENYRDLYLIDTSCLPGGCIFVTFSVELDDQKPLLAREVNEGFISLKLMIQKLLEQGKASGELKQETDTRAVTELIFAGMLGATVTYGMEKSPEKLDKTITALLDYLDKLSVESGLSK
jgi:TetR/AcrR family transcriptional regulator, transcriptional repressor for nem operon